MKYSCKKYQEKKPQKTAVKNVKKRRHEVVEDVKKKKATKNDLKISAEDVKKGLSVYTVATRHAAFPRFRHSEFSLVNLQFFFFLTYLNLPREKLSICN